MKFKDVIDYLNSGGMVRSRLWQDGEYLICDKQQNVYYYCSGKHRREFKLTPIIAQRDCWEFFESKYKQCRICGKFPIVNKVEIISSSNQRIRVECSDHSYDGIPHNVMIYGSNQEVAISNWNLVNKV